MRREPGAASQLTMRALHPRYRVCLLLLLLLLVPLALAQTFPPTLNKRKTPPPKVQQGLVFGVFGDTRPNGDPSRLRITSEVARAMMADRPQFVLATGDYVDGGSSLAQTQQQWQRFFSSISPLLKPEPVPVALAVGNHDVEGGMGGVFEQYFGRRYFSFDSGDVHNIILDTEQGGQVGKIAGVQWDWLVQDLAAAANSRLIFVTLHQPLFPVSSHRGSSLDRYPPYRDRLHILFARYKVSAVFCGHEHLYNHQERDGVHYFITGGGGAPLYADSAHGGFYHYLLVQCSQDSYTVQVKRLNL